MSTRLFVGNLPFTVTELDMKEIFGQLGAVEAAKLVTDRMTGRSRGFGFVEMVNEEEAKIAVTRLNGAELEGRTLTVNVAHPVAEGSAGGGGREGGNSRGGRRDSRSNRGPRRDGNSE